MKFWKILAVIMGLAMIAGGIYCAMTPVETYLSVAWYVVALGVLVDGISRIVAWSQGRKNGTAYGWLLVSGILSTAVGAFLLASVIAQAVVDVVILYTTGAWLVVRGLLEIIFSFKVRKAEKALEDVVFWKRWYVLLIAGLLVIGLGVFCLCHPLFTAAVIGILIGLGIAVAGADLITIATTVYK